MSVRSVMRLCREAWKGQSWLDFWVSIVAPLAVLGATAHTLYIYRNDEQSKLAVSLILMVVMVSLGLFVYVRSFSSEKSTRKGDKDNQPSRNTTMLAFATGLFTMGLAFTIAEMCDHLWMRIGPSSSGSRPEFDSPWGDVLLAFSAFCMLAEEFSLLNLYDKVKRTLDEAKDSSIKAIKKASEIDNLYLGAKESSEKIESLKMRAEGEIPILVVLGWFVVGCIALVAFSTLDEVGRLRRDVREMNRALEEFSQENESDDAGGQGRASVGQATEDTGESSNVNSTGSPEAANGSPPNIAEPSPPAGSAEPNVAEPSPPNGAAGVVEPSPPNNAETNSAETDPPNDAETNNANVAEPGSPNVADPSPLNVAEPGLSNIADPSPPPNVAEPIAEADPPQRR